jgi:hypothetical protein
MKTISLKTHYVSTDGWRGYTEPINAVAGANDTGTWSDSPCPSHVAERELMDIKHILRRNKIKFRHTYCQSSNAFCMHRYIVVHEDDVQRAREIIAEQIDMSDYLLLYPV